MPRIKWITDEEATGKVLEAFREVRRRYGGNLGDETPLLQPATRSNEADNRSVCCRSFSTRFPEQASEGDDCHLRFGAQPVPLLTGLAWVLPAGSGSR